MTNHEEMEKLIRIASSHRLVKFVYLKKAKLVDTKARVVEAYNFTQGKQDLMVRCYQVDPEPGWRFFMRHKITQVEDTGEAFRPRRTVSLESGLIDDRTEKSAHWTDARSEYRDLVSDALSDGRLSRSEWADIQELKEREALKHNDIRFVHASLYHRCLGAVLEDGEIGPEELDQIGFLNKALGFLGWSPADGVEAS